MQLGERMWEKLFVFAESALLLPIRLIEDSTCILPAKGCNILFPPVAIHHSICSSFPEKWKSEMGFPCFGSLGHF